METSSVDTVAAAADMVVLTAMAAEMEEKPTQSPRMAVVLPGLKPAGRGCRRRAGAGLRAQKGGGREQRHGQLPVLLVAAGERCPGLVLASWAKRGSSGGAQA